MIAWIALLELAFAIIALAFTVFDIAENSVFAALIVVVGFAFAVVAVKAGGADSAHAFTITAWACTVCDVADLFVIAAVFVVVYFAGASIDVIAGFAFCGFTDARITADRDAIAYLGWDARISVIAAVFVVVGFAFAVVAVKAGVAGSAFVVRGGKYPRIIIGASSWRWRTFCYG